MLWSDKAFRIYIGGAGEGIDATRGDAATDAQAAARTQAVSDDCGDVVVAPSGGWFTRTISALADRATLTRIARS
jgi:hypothetical protein